MLFLVKCFTKLCNCEVTMQAMLWQVFISTEIIEMTFIISYIRIYRRLLRSRQLEELVLVFRLGGPTKV